MAVFASWKKFGAVCLTVLLVISLPVENAPASAQPKSKTFMEELVALNGTCEFPPPDVLTQQSLWFADISKQCGKKELLCELLVLANHRICLSNISKQLFPKSSTDLVKQAPVETVDGFCQEFSKLISPAVFSQFQADGYVKKLQKYWSQGGCKESCNRTRGDFNTGVIAPLCILTFQSFKIIDDNKSNRVHGTIVENQSPSSVMSDGTSKVATMRDRKSHPGFFAAFPVYNPDENMSSRKYKVTKTKASPTVVESVGDSQAEQMQNMGGIPSPTIVAVKDETAKQHGQFLPSTKDSIVTPTQRKGISENNTDESNQMTPLQQIYFSSSSSDKTQADTSTNNNDSSFIPSAGLKQENGGDVGKTKLQTPTGSNAGVPNPEDGSVLRLEKFKSPADTVQAQTTNDKENVLQGDAITHDSTLLQDNTKISADDENVISKDISKKTHTTKGYSGINENFFIKSSADETTATHTEFVTNQRQPDGASQVPVNSSVNFVTGPDSSSLRHASSLKTVNEIEMSQSSVMSLSDTVPAVAKIASDKEITPVSAIAPSAKSMSFPTLASSPDVKKSSNRLPYYNKDNFSGEIEGDKANQKQDSSLLKPPVQAKSDNDDIEADTDADDLGAVGGQDENNDTDSDSLDQNDKVRHGLGIPIPNTMPINFQNDKKYPSEGEIKTYDRKNYFRGTYDSPSHNDEDVGFFNYFLSFLAICGICWLLFYNKKRIIAMVVEGRRPRSARRRSSSGGYRKLENNFD